MPHTTAALALFLSPLVLAQGPVEPRTSQQVAQDYLAAYGRFDLDGLRPFWTARTVFADPTSAEIGAPVPPTRGGDAIARLLRDALAGLVAPSIEYSECFASGGHAVGIGRLRFSLPAGNVPLARRDATFDLRVVSVLRIEGSAVVEHTDFTDFSSYHQHLAAARAVAEAPTFPEGSLDQALAQARARQQPLFVLVSAPFCIACHRMDHTTWLEPRVRAWLSANAVTVRIAPQALDGVAAKLEVRGFPTVLRLDGGVETARLTGLRTADDVVAWLAGAAPAPGEPTTLAQQYDRAVDLLLGGADAAATARALVAVWIRIGAETDAPPLLRWLRRERLPSMLASLGKDATGRQEVAALLVGFPADGPEPVAPAPLVADWLAVQQALGEVGTIDAWTDRLLGSVDGRACLGQQPAVFARLVARDRLADAGRVAGPQLWSYWLARGRGEPTGDEVGDAMPEQAIAKDTERAPAMLQTFVAALRAASRTEAAAQLEALARRVGR